VKKQQQQQQIDSQSIDIAIILEKVFIAVLLNGGVNYCNVALLANSTAPLIASS
jgi:hypothetical protein